MWAIDTLIGFRDQRQVHAVPSAKDQGVRHPAEYMFREVPADLPSDDRSAAIAETLTKMDAHNVRHGLISLSDKLAPEALRRHPERFLASMFVDGNEGMEAVRKIARAVEKFDIRAVGLFPSGIKPQIPINDKKWYPVYAKCIELDLPVFCATGVPGPRVPMMPQYVGLIDEVCYDFPELKFVMRHGAEPWEDLAVKLLLKWPNLYYSTSAFAPKHYPKAIIDFANTRGSDKIIYAGYYPFGIELERTFSELDDVPLKPDVWPKFLRDNAARLLRLPTD
ncbi:MAG: amidohydrolase [Novosphingobium sp.]|nr:MAG: amidohydrolase [Novosphingobium sp.]